MIVNKPKKKKTISRYTVLYIIMAVIFTSLFSKLLYLQVYKYDDYKEKADTSSTKFISESAPRGIIYDSDGNILATSEQTYVLTYMQTTESANAIFSTLDKVFKVLSENGENFEDDLLLKVNSNGQFYFAFKNDNSDVKEATELLFKNDRGLKDEVVKKLYKNHDGDFTDEELIKTDTEEEQEEEEPLEKPDQIEVKIGDKTYVICEDITEEDAPAGFKLAKAKYGEWDWEIAVYSDEEGNYVLVCLMVKETEDRQFFRYNEEKGTFNDEIPVSVAEFMEYKNLAAAAAADDEEEENDSVLVPVLIGVLIVAAAGVIVLQVNIIRKRKNSEEW